MYSNWDPYGTDKHDLFVLKHTMELLSCQNFKMSLFCCDNSFFIGRMLINATSAVSQWVRALAPQAEGRVFESRPRQTLLVKTGCDSSTAKRSALGLSVTVPQKWPL